LDGGATSVTTGCGLLSLVHIGSARSDLHMVKMDIKMAHYQWRRWWWRASLYLIFT